MWHLRFPFWEILQTKQIIPAHNLHILKLDQMVSLSHNPSLKIGGPTISIQFVLGLQQRKHNCHATWEAWNLHTKFSQPSHKKEIHHESCGQPWPQPQNTRDSYMQSSSRILSLHDYRKHHGMIPVKFSAWRPYLDPDLRHVFQKI